MSSTESFEAKSALYAAARQFEEDAFQEVSHALPSDRADAFAIARLERSINYRVNGEFSLNQPLAGVREIIVDRFDGEAGIYAVHTINNEAPERRESMEGRVFIISPEGDAGSIDRLEATMVDLASIADPEPEHRGGPVGYFEAFSRQQGAALTIGEMVTLQGVIEVVPLDVEATIIENQL